MVLGRRCTYQCHGVNGDRYIARSVDIRNVDGPIDHDVMCRLHNVVPVVRLNSRRRERANGQPEIESVVVQDAISET